MQPRDLVDALRSRWRSLSLLAATAVLLSAFDVHTLLTAPHLAGRDLAANEAFTMLMRENLARGTVADWTSRWLLGIPAFATYPPLFFIAAAAATLLTPLPLHTVYTGAVVVIPVLLPVTAYRSLRDRVGPDRAFFAGAASLFALFVYPPVAVAYQTVSVGLVAQGFALLLLLLTIGILHRDDRRGLLAAGVLVGLTALAHPFVGLVAAITVLAFTLRHRDPGRLLSLLPAAILVLPWVLRLLPHLPYMARYTFAPANPGSFLLYLLPLIVLGAMRDRDSQALGVAFLAVLTISAVETPFIAQELRFYTYALVIGAVLTGFGLHRVRGHVRGTWPSVPAPVVTTVLLLPVLLLPLHAGLPRTWDAGPSPGPVVEALDDRPAGRVLVETRNESMATSFMVQSAVLLRTGHAAANDVHVDATPAANYLLTLESWISAEPLYSPVCRTCDTAAPPAMLQQRLDDLGIRYVVTRTPAATAFLNASLVSHGRYGDYALFENVDGSRPVAPLAEDPVALTGSYADWLRVNDALLTANVSRPVVWARGEEPPYAADTVSMEGSAAEILDAVRAAPSSPLPDASVSVTMDGDRAVLRADTDRPVPVRLKVAWSPRHTGAPLRPARFNTVTVWVEENATVRFR